ncbi:MAG: hypothetical protein RLZZ306_3282 [Bacteroidota bacterium]|jgi:hypothetical protein
MLSQITTGWKPVLLVWNNHLSFLSETVFHPVLDV